MNIKVQCCGIALLFVIYLFYRSKKTLRLHTEVAFLRFFCIDIISISIDILSVIMIAHSDRLPNIVIIIVCKCYLLSLVSLGLFALLYLFTDIYQKNKSYKKHLAVLSVICVMATLAIIVLPLNYVFKPEVNIVYSEGPSVLCTYATTIGLIVYTIIILLTKSKDLLPGRNNAMFIWISIWISSALIQFLYNELLLVSFAGAVGLLVIFLQFENPELNLDRDTSLFNLNAFTQFTKQLYISNTQFYVLSVTLDTRFSDDSPQTSLDILKNISGYVAGINNIYGFKISEEEVIFILIANSTPGDLIKNIQDKFDKELSNTNNKNLYADFIYIPNPRQVNSGKELLELIAYSKNTTKESYENHFLLVEDHFASEMQNDTMIQQLILDAIENDRVEVYYQPIYSTKENIFTSAEALVRILDENGKMIPPGKFISIAEKNGLIIKLGEIVFEKVCCCFKKYHLEQLGIHYIEVNLSIVQCAYEYLAYDFIKIMERHNIDSKYINLEITESASLSAKKTLLDNMKMLINYGVRFSLDDFGTGQSNLNYIVEMPVHIVKFDKDMTTAYFEGGKAKYVMDAAMHMIQGMELEIVSEGIETAKQFETACSLGIDYIQGYYFSKPLAEKEFINFIIEKNKLSHNNS